MRGAKFDYDIRHLQSTVNQLVQGRSNATSASHELADPETGVITLPAADPGWVNNEFTIYDPTITKASTIYLQPANLNTLLAQDGIFISEQGDGYFKIKRVDQENSMAIGQIGEESGSTTFVSDVDDPLEGTDQDPILNMSVSPDNTRLITNATGWHTWSVTIAFDEIGAGNNRESQAGIRLIDTNGTTELGEYAIPLASSIGSGSNSYDFGSMAASGFVDMVPGQSIQAFGLHTFSGSCTYDLIMSLETTVARPFGIETEDLAFKYLFMGG